MERGSIYPSWRYHKTEPPVLCEGPEQDAQLGDEWSDEDIREFGAPQADAPAEAPADEGGSMHDLSAKDAAALAADADLATAKALLETEQANPNKEGGRPSVIKAIEKRIAALQA
jgi:hypothetical protein